MTQRRAGVTEGAPTPPGDILATDPSTQKVPTDDWSVPKLLGLAVLVLGGFFVFINTISP